MGSGVVMHLNDNTWLQLEKWSDSRTRNAIDVTLSCRVSANDD